MRKPRTATAGNCITCHWYSTAPATPADYERCDLGPLQPEARFIGLVDEGSDMAGLISVHRKRARTHRPADRQHPPLHRKYAEALIFKTLIEVLPAKASVNITACTPQSKDKPIWSIQFQLGNGATVEDARKQSARIQSSVGAKHIYWEWRSADSATVWLCDDPCLDVRDISHWNRRSKQKHLIELALSDSWGVAGVSDPSGRTPDVVSLGALPSNHDVLLARFQIPAGLDVDKPSRNIGKFLTSADYAYGASSRAARNTVRTCTTWCWRNAARSPPWSTRTGISPASRNHACSRWAWTIWANRSTGA